MKCILLCTALLIFARATPAETCVVVQGDQILASDLARVAPLFAQLKPDLVIAPSPAPGIRRTMGSAELRQVARRYQLPEVTANSVCFEQAMEPLTEQRILEALRKSLGQDEGAIEITEFSKFRVPRGELEFPRSGLNAAAPNGADTPVLWRGSLRFGNRRSLAVWARVRIRIPRRQIVATRDVPAGRPLSEQDLAEQKVEGLPLGEQPIGSIQLAAGTLPRRRIRRGEVLLASILRMPSEVQRGDLVNVEVTSGTARLQFEGKAETEGSRGAPVLVKNPTTGKRFTATVESKGKVAVHIR